VPKTSTLNSFIVAFEASGYELCENATFQEGVEKVVIYVDDDGEPTHAARQTETGQWTSKLGQDVDIEHSGIEGVEGPTYGSVAAILQRPMRRG
jgi:hypothetical protein